MNNSPLPEGWKSAALRNPKYFSVVMGQSPPSRTYNLTGAGLPFFQGKAEFGDLYPTPNKYCSGPLRIAENDDVLLSVRAPVGPTNMANCKCCIGRGLAAIRCTQKVLPKFLLYAMRSIEVDIAASVRDQGGGFTAIRREQLEAIEILIPPLEEQTRIVYRIEVLTQRANDVRHILKEAEAEIAAFTPALLSKAFRGEL